MTHASSTSNKPLRLICFMLAGFSLLAVVFDIVAHMVIVSQITGGYQCDTTPEMVRKAVYLYWVEPMFLIFNIGSHGIYPLAALMHYTKYPLFEYYRYRTVSSTPACYENTLHVYCVDFLELLLNILYFLCVVIYIDGLKNKNLRLIRFFVYFSTVKFIMYILFICYVPYWAEIFNKVQNVVVSVMDLFLIACGLLLMHQYLRDLKKELDGEPILIRRIYRRRIVPLRHYPQGHVIGNDQATQDTTPTTTVTEVDVEPQEKEKEKESNIIIGVDTDNLNPEEPHSSKQSTYL